MPDSDSAAHRQGPPSNPGNTPEVSERQSAFPPQREIRSRVIWGDGNQWRVREAEYPVEDRRSGRSLIFETDEIIRRVRDYPFDWFELPDDELYRLSLGKTGQL
jgi:hypothetical protein